MASKFQLANELVILSSGRRISHATARRWSNLASGAGDAPTSDSDGAPIEGAIVASLQAKMRGSGQTGVISVWLYDADGEGWMVARNGKDIAVTDEGITERLTVAGYDRVYVQWVSYSGSAESWARIGLGVSE